MEEVLRRSPKSESAANLIAITLEQQGRYSEAERAYERVLQIAPESGFAMNNLAWLYASNDGRLDEALQLAQGAKVRYPSDPNVNDTLGWIYYKKGLIGPAVTALQEAAGKAPNVAVIQYHLGFALARQGQTKLARQALEAALKLDPKAVDAAEARSVLAQLATLGS
jgi:tetratricopeptide (TPR) repeat protein